MLTDEDIKKLIAICATKEDIKEATANLATKDEINELQISLDAYSKKADTYFEEMVSMSRKMDRHEQWIHELAEKVGVKLGY